ncbi:MAG: translation initiation factor 1 [Planctomycetota bacterium]|jgi:translation initiation factor 1
MQSGDSNSRPVFSSDDGELCPKCAKVMNQCRCATAEIAIPNGKDIRIAFDAKGRRGKAVTLISGLPMAEKQLKLFAKQLKKKCGSGGSVKDGVIEIQGDQRDKLAAELNKQGFTIKLLR